ncbi:MAG: hypothetical protein AB8F95_07305 [Bacteroidia bacterium]
MKKLQTLLLPLIAILAFSLTSCETDDTPPTPIGPTIDLLADAGIVSSIDTVDAAAEFTVRLTATSGNSRILGVEVLENDESITDLSRIKYDGIAANANPVLLFGADTASFTKDITVVAHGVYDEARTYSFKVSDANGESKTVSVEIRTELEIVTTPVDSFTLVIVNNGDGPDFGGLDLSAGVAVSSSSVDADVRDMGIDLAEPAATNWIQKLVPVNGAMMSTPDAGFDYAATTNKEAIEAAYSLSTQITEPASKLVAGDVLFVRADETTYVIQIAKVNVVTTDNTDTYELNIKY